MQQLRIGTWNIGGGFVSSHQPLAFDTEDLAYFSTFLKPLACDLLCFQEVHTPLTPTQHGQAEILANALGMPYWIATPCDTVRTSHLKSDQWLSLAILSRWQFADANYSLLPNPQLSLQTATGITLLSHDKGFLKIKLPFANQALAVLTGHALPFGLFGRDVMEEMFDPIRRAMEQVILASPDQPTIVAGDLNYTSTSTCYQTYLTLVTQAHWLMLLQNQAAASNWITFYSRRIGNCCKAPSSLPALTTIFAMLTLPLKDRKRFASALLKINL